MKNNFFLLFCNVGLLLGMLVGARAENAEGLGDVLNRFQFSVDGAAIDLAVVKAHIPETMNAVPELLSQTNRPVESKLSLIILLGQLQRATKVIAESSYLPELRPFVDACRRIDSKKTGSVLFYAMGPLKPFVSHDVWDSLLTEAEMRQMNFVYRDWLSFWIIEGRVKKAEHIARVGKGFEEDALMLLVHNLESVDPYVRVDAAIALTKLYEGNIDYNPVGSAEERAGAIKQWRALSSQYRKKNHAAVGKNEKKKP